MGAAQIQEWPLGVDTYQRVVGMTLDELLTEVAEATPDKEALVIADERLTYGQMLKRSRMFAQALVALGVGPGDRVDLLMPNSADAVCAMFGTALAGGIFVPVNTRYKAGELNFVLADSAPTVVITTDAVSDYVDFRPLLHEALPGLADSSDALDVAVGSVPTLRSVVLLGSSTSTGMLDEESFFRGAAGQPLPELPRAVTDIAAIIYTSGTTSNPRGAMLTHRALVGHWSIAGRQWAFSPDDRFCDPCPLFHIAAIGPLVWTVAHGATFMSDTYFDAGRSLRQISQEKATLIYPTYPPIMRDLMTHEDFVSADLSSVRAFLNVAPPDDLRAMQAAIPHAAQITLYGSTEGGPVTMHHVDDPLEMRLSTNGHPVEGVQVRIADLVTGEELPVGVAGEIQYRGPNTFSGYYNDAAKTADSIDSEGWVHTGDSGSKNTDGSFNYLGRVKEMLKVGGENLAPAEVEEVLANHPAVKLVAVVGMPDPRLVEVPAAFVELAPGMQADEDELIGYCRDRMARYKVPRTIRFVTEWPMSATKIQRSKLREQLLNESAASAG